MTAAGQRTGTDWTARLIEVNRGGPSKIVLAYLHPGEVAQSFHGSLMDTLAFDQDGRFTDPAGRLAIVSSFAGAGGIARGRNDAVTNFLDGHRHADLLMFVDADMGWDPDSVEFLARVMEETGHPIVGGLCFVAKAFPPQAGQQRAHHVDIFPTLYAWNTRTNPDGERGFDTKWDYPDDGLVEVAATGAAFLMIDRQCLERIREAEGDNWFTPILLEGNQKPSGEDISFCVRARKHGFPVHVHTGVKTSHRKSVWVNEAMYKESRTPSASAVTVVIPVKDNLEMTRHLVCQLANQGAVTDIVLFDNGSEDPEMVEWLETQTWATVCFAPGESISRMWNEGIEEALRRHRGLADVVFLNNDVALGPRAIKRLIAGLRSKSGLLAACPNYDQRRGSGVSPLRGICAGRYDGHGGFAGFAFALRAEWIAGGFRFDENMAWWYSDNDLLLEIEKAGGWYGMVHDSEIVHLDGGGQTERPEWWDDRVAKDKAAFHAKWPHVQLVEWNHLDPGNATPVAS